MSPARHIGLTTAVALLVTGLIGGTVVLANERQQQNRLTDQRRETAQTLAPAAKSPRKPAVRLTATPRTLTAGSRVTLRIRTSTRHPRPVRLQRWDSKRKVWRHVARRTVRATTSVQVTAPVGTTRYRAHATRIRHRSGGKTHTHGGAYSSTAIVTAKPRRTAPEPTPRPAAMTADEKALFAAVTTARSTYARAEITSSRSAGAETCLTAYARQHSAWMATLGAAFDPGSAEHRTAKRPLPAVACPGHTVVAVTRAIGAAETTDQAISLAVDSWLSSPHGAPDRLLSACHNAPAFEFGVAAESSAGARWFTVLIASDTAATRSSGVC